MVKRIIFSTLILFSAFSKADYFYEDQFSITLWIEGSLFQSTTPRDACHSLLTNSSYFTVDNPNRTIDYPNSYFDIDGALRCPMSNGFTLAVTETVNSNFYIDSWSDSIPEPEPETDTDNDGIPNSEDNDIDGDGIPNSQDDDVDGDGVPNYIDDTPYGEDTAIPSYDDMDGDGIPDSTDNDIDGDGIPNYIDPDPLSPINLDNDGDGIPNNQDDDIDGDGILNSEDDDIDGDGIPNSEDSDLDGDGSFNSQDSDVDGDGIPNSEDDDIDGDGVPNTIDNSPNGININSPEEGPSYCTINGFYMGKGDCSNYATDDNGDGEYTADEVNDPSKLTDTPVPIGSQPDAPVVLETGYWTPYYPDGFSGIFLQFQEDLKKSKFYEFLNSFKFSHSTATAPVWSFNLDMGVVDLGTHAIDLDALFPGFFGYIKVFMLISAVFAAYRIVF